jgi:hypothetical protein
MSERINPRWRGVYRLQARNLRYGVWTGDLWVGIREKFGDLYLDASEVPGRTAWPLEFIEVLPDEIEAVTSIGSCCSVCDRSVDFDASRGTTACERWQHIDGPADHCVRPRSRRNQALFDYLMQYERR